MQARDFFSSRWISIMSVCLQRHEHVYRLHNFIRKNCTPHCEIWEHCRHNIYKKRAAFALSKFLKSKLFSKKTKTRLYTAIIRPTLTYECETWTTTNNTGRKLWTFENKIWRIICGSVYDNRTGAWRRKFNRELQDELELALVTSFISGQRIQRLGHVMRRNEKETVRTVMEWRPTGKRPRGWPRKIWLDTAEEDLRKKRSTRVKDNGS
jgi:hypothetical protein